MFGRRAVILARLGREGGASRCQFCDVMVMVGGGGELVRIHRLLRELWLL